MKFRLIESLEKATPYMIRNDGKVFKCKGYHPYICNIYDDDNDLKSLVNERLDELLWFYNNSNNNFVKAYSRVIVKYLCNNNENIFHDANELYNLFSIDDSVYLCFDNKEVLSFLHALDNDVNQEFCKVRTSDVKYGGDSNDIYFRISSIGFNWFNIIWEFVYTNKNLISSITIAKDGRVRDYSLNDCYKINGLAIDHIPTNDFLTLQGNPVMESFVGTLKAINEANTQLQFGATLEESYPNLHPRDLNGFYKKHKSEQLDWDVENILSWDGRFLEVKYNGRIYSVNPRYFEYVKIERK